MKKIEEIKKILSLPVIIAILLIVLISSIGTSYAANFLFNSKDVRYDNATSGIKSDNVQGAIDELYGSATDYSTYNARLTAVEDFKNQIYPVGSIYISVNNVNPSTLFGGTWVAFGTGKTLVGVDTSDADFDKVEESHGSKTKTLAVTNIPEHQHYYTPAGTNSGTAVSDHTYTPAGSINVAISDHTYTPAGSINVAISDHTYTPAGTISKPTFTGTRAQTETSGEHSHYLGPLWNADGGSGNRTTIQGYPVGNRSGQYSVVTDLAGNHTHYYTPSGTVSQPTFTGTKATLGHTVSTKTFTGTKATLGHTVSTKTFTGTKATLSHTVTQPTFKGTRAQTEKTGSGTAFSTMDPYITVYMWKRTA